jgi:FAD/FMN-containing dehydrogenase
VVLVTRPDTRATALRGLCGGAVHLPGDRDYDLARAPWNLAVEHHPAAVAYPAFPDEVAAVLQAARRAGLSVVPQGTGHGTAPFDGRLSDSVLLRTSAMTEVRVDGRRRRARAGAGARWGELAAAAGRHGLAGLHASSPDVGVVGYTLGGGLSWYARSAGLQSSLMTAAEVVLADGTFVRATSRDEPELLWALKGGGGGLGVVTAVEFELLPLPTVTAGMLVWDWTEAERVLPAWVAWARTAPESVTTSFRVIHAPPLPHVPPDLRGRRLAVVDGTALGTDAEAAEVLAPLRALRPELDTFLRVPAASLVHLHLEPEGPTSAYARSALLRDVPDQAVEALLEVAGPGSDSALAVAELRQLGGAVSRPDPRGGALDRLDGQFLLLGLGFDPDPARWQQIVDDAARLLDAVRPWQSGTLYLPMMEDQAQADSGFSPEAYARLAAARRAVDPEGLFLPLHRD